MALEEKYERKSIDYIVNVVKRKLIGALYTYPEFMFLFKILAILLVAVIAFTLFRKSFGI